jgi:2-dehydropantoate 2-reductase
LPAAAVADVERHVWRKLAVNVAINGPTALAGVPNGAVATEADLGQAAEILAGEVEAVARTRGLELGDVAAAVAEVVRSTAANHSSMLQDLEQGRRTEVAAIYGAVVAEATRVGLAVPTTRVVAALLAAREGRVAAGYPELGLIDGSDKGEHR